MDFCVILDITALCRFAEMDAYVGIWISEEKEDKTQEIHQLILEY